MAFYGMDPVYAGAGRISATFFSGFPHFKTCRLKKIQRMKREFKVSFPDVLLIGYSAISMPENVINGRLLSEIV